jgi:hypothetical protein
VWTVQYELEWTHLRYVAVSLAVECLSLGDEWLDAPLKGGLGEGITELVGEAACGKTQLAMQLLLQVRGGWRAPSSDSSTTRRLASATSSHFLRCSMPWLVMVCSVNCLCPKAVSVVVRCFSRWRVTFRSIVCAVWPRASSDDIRK